MNLSNILECKILGHMHNNLIIFVTWIADPIVIVHIKQWKSGLDDADGFRNFACVRGKFCVIIPQHQQHPSM